MQEKITEEFVGCDKCRDTNGFIYEIDENGNQISKKCQCLLEYQQKQYLHLALSRANIPTSVLIYTIDSYIGTQSLSHVPKLKKYVHEFKEKYYDTHLYIYGPNSTQKTTLAMWIGRELLVQKVSVYYVLMDNMVRALTQEQFEEEFQKLISKINSVDCLIIDEAFDKEKVTWYKSGYQLTFLDRFLRHRMESDRKATIFVSNKDVISIRSNFSTSVFELIQRNTSQTQLQFIDHYTKKDDFKGKDIWGD